MDYEVFVYYHFKNRRKTLHILIHIQLTLTVSPW
jgi:hypothetical protein